MQKIKIVSEGKIRLDDFLRNKLPLFIKEKESLSNSKVRRMIIAGTVSVNNIVVKRPAFELRGKSVVQIEFDEEKFFYEKQPDDIKFEVTDKSVLSEDENLIFINKPSLFPVEQTITGNRDNLHDKVVEYLWKKNPSLKNPPYVGIMHRLDRETSGVILFTKNRPINKSVHELFENHDFVKEYYAVCTKNNSNKKNLSIGLKFTVEKFIGRVSLKSQAGKWGSLSKEKGGLYSKTEFFICDCFLQDGIEYYLVKCSLFTGRTHQIRVHLSEEGFPILGDSLYGGKSFDRLCLHSSRLNFVLGDKNYEVSADFPEIYKKFFKKY